MENAIEGSNCMSEDEYNRLVKQRNELKGLLSYAKSPAHRKVIEDQLITIRKAIKDAHRDQYRESSSSGE
jgi:hypothetical protein